MQIPSTRSRGHSRPVSALSPVYRPIGLGSQPSSPHGLQPAVPNPWPLGIVISFLAIIILLPCLIVVAALVKLQDGGPILFGQSRIGKDMRNFKCLKFRSMRTDAPQLLAALLDNNPKVREEWLADHKLRNDPRITPLGNFIRKSSLDELPHSSTFWWVT